MLLPGVVLTVVFKYGSMFGIVMAFQRFDIFKGTFSVRNGQAITDSETLFIFLKWKNSGTRCVIRY